MQHKNITGSDVHVLHAYTYADATARTAATGFVLADVGKAALQQSDNTLWALTNHSPIAWVQVGTGATPGTHSHAIADVTNLQTTLDGKAASTHTHAQADITNLTTDLAAKAPLASPALTGTPTAPTATAGTNTTQIATTAFVAAAVASGGGTLDGLSDVTITTPSSGQVLKYNGTGWVNDTDSTGGGGSSSPTSAVRQTVLSGGVDSSGFANFLSAGTGLAVNLAATSVPVVIGFAAGFDTSGNPVDYFGRIAADTSIGSLTANATNYLYATYSAGTVSLGATTIAPTYSAAEQGPQAVGNVATSATVTTNIPTYQNNDAAFGPAFLNNGIETDYFHSDNIGGTTGLNLYVRFAFASAKTIGKYRIKPYNDTNRIFKDFTLQGSSDGGSTWTTVDTQSATGWAGETFRDFTLSAPVSYQDFRFVITSTVGDVYIVCREIELIEYSTHIAGTSWFDLSTMVMKVSNGSAWAAANRVFLGEGVTDGTGVTSVTTYALRGEYLPETFTVAAATNITKNHNIGTDKALVQPLVATSSGGAQGAVLPSSVTRNSVIFNSGTGAVEGRVVARRAF